MMYSNNIVNFQESTTILNASTKKSGNLLKALHKIEKHFTESLKYEKNIKLSIKITPY